MHVALLDWVCDPLRPGVSGLSDIVWDLGRALRDLDEEVTVIGAYDRQAPTPPGGLRLYRLHRPKLWQRNVLGQLATCVALARAISRIPRPDVIFAPEYISPAVVATLHPRLPVTFTTPGNIYERISNGNPYDWVTTQVYKVAARTSARRCARVIALSEHMRTWWVWTGAPGEHVAVVPLGVDRSLYHPSSSPRERVDIAEGEETVLYTGRLSVEKNLPVVIEAVADLAKERPNLRLRLLGSGPEEESLRGLARRLGIETIVHFLGWVPRERVPDYYRAADVVVLPSTSEPLARVLLEAMACGTFIVGSRSGGTPDIIQDGRNGLLVAPNDVRGWRRALARAFEEPAWRRQLAEAGRRMVHEQLAWPVIARRIRDQVFEPGICEWRARGRGATLGRRKEEPLDQVTQK